MVFEIVVFPPNHQNILTEDCSKYAVSLRGNVRYTVDCCQAGTLGPAWHADLLLTVIHLQDVSSLAAGEKICPAGSNLARVPTAI